MQLIGLGLAFNLGKSEKKIKPKNTCKTLFFS